VPEILLVHGEFQAGFGAHAKDRDIHVVRMIDEATGDERDEITKFQIGVVGLATGGFITGRGGGTGTNDSFSPAHRKIVIHRANRRSVGSG